MTSYSCDLSESLQSAYYVWAEQTGKLSTGESFAAIKCLAGGYETEEIAQVAYGKVLELIPDMEAVKAANITIYVRKFTGKNLPVGEWNKCIAGEEA